MSAPMDEQVDSQELEELFLSSLNDFKIFKEQRHHQMLNLKNCQIPRNPKPNPCLQGKGKAKVEEGTPSLQQTIQYQHQQISRRIKKKRTRQPPQVHKANVGEGTPSSQQTIQYQHQQISLRIKKRTRQPSQVLYSRFIGKGKAKVGGETPSSQQTIQYQHQQISQRITKKNKATTTKTIKIISYNIWSLSNIEIHERMKAINQLVQQHSPDIILFQEVSTLTNKIFQKCNWWGLYDCSVPPEKVISQFCMLVLPCFYPSLLFKNLNPGFASQMIKIMSYNVWFREDVEVRARMKAIGQLIQEHSPDIIFFQEVTPNIYELFQDSNWWRTYRCSVPPEKVTKTYFCMLLSKLPVERFVSKPFHNSWMGRDLCAAEIDAGANKKLVVATSHLESPTPPEMNSVERVAQANEALSLLNSVPNVIFGGDMNWDEISDGPFPLRGGWQDAWSVLRPEENGWTYDTRSNMMLKGNRPLSKRLDRFVCKLQDFRMVSVDMIGRDAIPGISYYNKRKELPVLPSDHYGLVLTICPM